MTRSSFIGFLLSVIVLLATASRALAQPVVLVLGDSLSAGFGIDRDEGWVSLLEGRLAAQGYGHRVVNASSSGETTGGGRARLPRALELHDPDVVIIELGGNDALRGLPLDDVSGNLAAMIRSSLEKGARVLLVGMHIPPNYGPAYTQAFHSMYTELAQRFDVPLVPFFLEGVALDPGLMQEDGIHPNERAQLRLLDNVWSALEPLLETPSGG